MAYLRYHDHVQQFDRITMNPEVMGGKPCIRGMRVTVGMIVEALAAGRTIDELLADFSYIEEPEYSRSSRLRRTPGSGTRDQACELIRLLIAWCSSVVNRAIVTLDWSGKPRARV